MKPIFTRQQVFFLVLHAQYRIVKIFLKVYLVMNIHGLNNSEEQFHFSSFTNIGVSHFVVPQHGEGGGVSQHGGPVLILGFTILRTAVS